MILSASMSLFILILCGICTFAERLLPFLIFGNRKVPDVIQYLGRILPMAVIATLVVYCLRSTTLTAPAGFVPQLAAVALTAVLHFKIGNTLLSVVSGTVCYMLLIQFVF